MHSVAFIYSTKLYCADTHIDIFVSLYDLYQFYYDYSQKLANFNIIIVLYMTTERHNAEVFDAYCILPANPDVISSFLAQLFSDISRSVIFRARNEEITSGFADYTLLPSSFGF
jgi:hypothetical protein